MITSPEIGNPDQPMQGEVEDDPLPEVYAVEQLTDTLNNALGLDDSSLIKEGLGRELSHTSRLSGSKGRYGKDWHLVALDRITGIEGSRCDEHFSIEVCNKEGTMEIAWSRRRGNESTQSLLVTVNEHGEVVEDLPAEDRKIRKEKGDGGKLSRTEAEKFIENVQIEFNKEYTRRLDILKRYGRIKVLDD